MNARVSEEIRHGLIEDYSKGIEEFLRDFTGDRELATEMELVIRGLMLLATDPKLESHRGLLSVAFTHKMLDFLFALSVSDFKRAVADFNRELGLP